MQQKQKIMKYYLVNWDIRDGDNEYREFEVVKTAKKFKDEKLFKIVLDSFYLTDKDYKLKKYEDGKYDIYELPNDYRLVELVNVSEISEEAYKAILETRLAYGMEF